MRIKLTYFFVLFIIYYGQSQNCTSDFLFSTIGEISFGIAKDQGYFWVSDNDSQFNASEINIYDESGNYVETILEEQGIENAILGLELVNDTLWAVKEQSSQLLKLNKMTGELYAVYDLPSFNEEESNNTGITFDGLYLWNSEHFSPNGTNLFKIDPTNGVILDTLNINLDRLMPLEFVNGRMLGITVDDEKLHEINLSTGETNFLVNWCIDPPFDLTYNVDEGVIYGMSIDFGLSSVHRIKGLDFLTTTEFAQVIDEHTFEVYPNPVNDILSVHTSTMDKFEFKILNSIGKICFEGNFIGSKMEKNIESYPPGIYYLLTQSNGKKSINKFVKI